MRIRLGSFAIELSIGMSTLNNSGSLSSLQFVCRHLMGAMYTMACLGLLNGLLSI